MFHIVDKDSLFGWSELACFLDLAFSRNDSSESTWSLLAQPGGVLPYASIAQFLSTDSQRTLKISTALSPSSSLLYASLPQKFQHLRLLDP